MSTPRELPPRLIRWRRAAHAVLWLEYAGVLLWAPLSILAAAIGLALLGATPPGLLGPLLLLASVAAAIAWAVHLARATTPPTEERAERRLEADSALRHRPFAVLRDSPAAATPAQHTIWLLHRAKASASLRHLRLAGPSARLSVRDPYALRAAAALLLLAGLAAAGPQAGERLATAFLPSFSTGPGATFQAWIEPPAYTGMAPIFLPREGGNLIVPAGSMLNVSLTGGSWKPGLDVPGGRIKFHDLGGASWQASGKLTESGPLTLGTWLSTLGTWHLNVLPNTPPVADFPAPPGKAGKSLETKIPWHVAQRWGVGSLTVTMRPAGFPDLPAITLPLPLPGAPKDAVGARLVDLSPNPYAGVEMQAQLTAKDVSGQTGESAPVKFTLPARLFKNGLARAIIDLRRRLALDKETTADAANDLEALALTPKEFAGHSGIFLNTVAVAGLLRANHSAAALEEAQQRLWIVALALDGALPEATQQALNDAVAAMQKALDEHANGKMTNDELSKAIEKLRQAMAQRMNDLARQAAKQGKIPPFDPHAQHFSSPLLDKLLRQLEQAVREGRQQDAKEKLAQLQNLLEKLNNAKVLSPQEAKQAEAGARKGKQLQGAIQDLTQREAGLMDRAQTRVPRSTLPPQFQPNLGNEPDPDQLEATEESRSQDATTQRALHQALDALKQQLGAALGQVPKPLNQAGEDMNAARDALMDGQEPAARQAEAKVIEDLRQGGKDTAKQMQAGQQLAIIPGARQPGDTGDEMGELPGGDGEDGPTDPLGRPLKQGVGGRAADDNSVKVPDEMEQLRSRAIQEELRRRGGDRSRPREELDYIDRLLRPF